MLKYGWNGQSDVLECEQHAHDQDANHRQEDHKLSSIGAHRTLPPELAILVSNVANIFCADNDLLVPGTFGLL
ncbi:MAG: hypothetical protein Kow0063_11860 [Anaerolineae bacterium]